MYIHICTCMCVYTYILHNVYRTLMHCGVCLHIYTHYMMFFRQDRRQRAFSLADLHLDFLSFSLNTCTCFFLSSFSHLSLKHVCMGRAASTQCLFPTLYAVLLCLVCLFDLACFFLSSFSSLIKNMYIHV